jgi:hypothetical protein
MERLFYCIDTIFKEYDYKNVIFDENLFKKHNNKDNAWISIDKNIYSIRKNDIILLKIFKDFYGKNVKDFILNNYIFNDIKFKIFILEKLKERRIGFLSFKEK